MSLGLFQTPAPQLVMLANVAAGTVEGCMSAISTVMSEGGGACPEGGGDKEMMELKTVGGNYSDDEEDENIIRYSYDDQSQREVCIVEYPESPAFNGVMVGQDDETDAREAEAPAPTKPTERKTPAPNPEPVPSPEKKTKKKPFHCKPCNFQAKTESEFVDHLQSHAVSKMLVVTKVEGRSHKGKEAEPERDDPEGTNQNAAGGDIKGIIRCERCGYNTNRYDHYISHLKHHSKDQEHRVFKCTLCPYTTVSQYHWRKHLRNHFPSKLHTCSQCSYFSDRKSNYVQHIRTHTGVRPFQCPYCDYSSSQKTHLTRHMRTHSGERPFKCESCDYLAANQHEVTRHARQVHNGPKPLVCPYCEYKTADRSNFKKHVELHLNPRQFNCPLCKYAASKKCNLQYHIKSRHAGCEVNLDISKVKLRVKKSDLDKEERNAEDDGLSDVAEELEEDFVEKEPTSPINLSIKNKKTPEETKKSSDIGKELDKKLKQKKIEDFVKAVERVMPKKRKGKVDEEEEARPKTDDTKATAKKEKKSKKPAPEKTVKKAKTSKRKAVEVLDLSHKEEPPKKTKKKKTVEDKPKKKKVMSKKEKDSKVKDKAEKAAERVEVEDIVENGQKKAKDSSVVDEKDQEIEKDLVETVSEKQDAVEEVTPEEQETSPSKSSKNDTNVAGILCENGEDKEDEAMEVEEESDNIVENGQAGREVEEKEQKSPEEGENVATERGSSAEDLSSKLLQNHESGTVLKDQNGDKSEEKSTEERTENPTENGTNVAEVLVQNKESSPEKPKSTPQTPSPSKEVFLKPSGRPPLVLQRQTSSSSSGGGGNATKTSECEEDEGIHEASSDVSDSASECSDDSGLKMLTPTEELPATPTELKAHLCIFCDRTFPFKNDYQRHLNRHLVNVYYMDSSKAHK